MSNLRILSRLSPAARTYVAVAICLSSAVLGVIAIHRGSGSVSSVAFNVACAWSLSGSWLAGDFTREGLRRFTIPASKIFQEARRGKLPKSPPLARVMNTGAGIMVLTGIAGWFV